MNSNVPLACDMNVFTPTQHDDHVQSTAHLFEAVQRIQEVENGYRFTFPNETELILNIAEFISNERLCCPFLKFTLNVTRNSESISLTLVGPEGTQEFLRAEFSGAFQ